MLKTKIYAIITARMLLWVFFSILYVGAFVVYVVFMVADWFIGFYEGYQVETKGMLQEFDKQLNDK